MEIKDFSYLFELVKKQPKRKLVVANGVDKHTLEALALAVNNEIVDVIITGNAKHIHDNCRALGLLSGQYAVYDSQSDEEAVATAVQLARSGEADIIMKGFVNTDIFMRAILNKEIGLLPKGALLSHITMLKNPAYYKLLFISDVAIIPNPNFEQKKQITKYLISVAHTFGVVNPKVAFIAATEKVIETMPACIDARELKKAWENGEFPNSYCDGPMAFDLAVNSESAKIKNYHSPVAGVADCLVFPNIEAGNVFYKTNTQWCNAEVAAIVVGTMVPTVLSSRGDSAQAKLNSIALAALIG